MDNSHDLAIGPDNFYDPALMPDNFHNLPYDPALGPDISRDPAHAIMMQIPLRSRLKQIKQSCSILLQYRSF